MSIATQSARIAIERCMAAALMCDEYELAPYAERARLYAQTLTDMLFKGGNSTPLAAETVVANAVADSCYIMLNMRGVTND
jgi:hypothetical protein